MTQYFEVHERDGAARLGELRLDTSVQTPALADDIIVDGGSLWTEEQPVPEGDTDQLTILPHRSMPPGTPATVQQSLSPGMPDIDTPSAAVISPETVTEHPVDAYVLSSPQPITGHARAFVETIIDIRETIPADTALYLPGIATPANVGILAYAGVDLVDTDRAVIAGTKGEYLTQGGRQPVDTLDELPCACPACQQTIETFDQEDCIEHNQRQLTAELRQVRNQIREGRLRDYLDAQARHEQWHTGVLRRLDRQWEYLEQRMPIVRNTNLTVTTDDELDRVEIKRFADRIANRYQPRLDDHPLVLLPCSARKPYSDSQSHRQFYEAIRYRGHIVSLTSPLGVVPHELELTYPAQHYDTVVTGEWSATEQSFVADVLRRYLETAEYPQIIAHVPEEGYREIVDRAVDDVDVTYTVEGHPTDESSLQALRNALDGESSYSRASRYRATVKAIADYMFGSGAGAELFGGCSVRGRYPKLLVENEDGEQLAAIVPEYGVLSLTLTGARRWESATVPTKTVEIDEFVPRGSVLAPGVVDADTTIRPADEVVVKGPNAFAVGRAQMSGPEMVESLRGVGVTIRHVTER